MLNALKPGVVVDGRYEIVELIGDGGMGSVFKARELGLERNIALKMLHPGLVGDKEHQERFKREGSLLSQLDHPNILRCYRFGIWNGMFPYIAMEFVKGVSLSSVIAESERLEPSRVLTIGQQICSAMEHAHRSKIIHRDLKPANIMLIADGEQETVKVLDFGLGRVLPEAGKASQHLTQTGTLIGSVYYMSPEQCMGKKCDARSDIYSLGCLLYEALTGAPPLMADTPVGLIYLHVNQYPDPMPPELLAEMPRDLETVLLKSMEKAPEERFESMDEFGTYLAAVQTGTPVQINRKECRHNLNKTKRRVWTIALLTCLFVGGGLLAALVAFNAGSRAPLGFRERRDAPLPKQFKHLPLTSPERMNEWLDKYAKADPVRELLVRCALYEYYATDTRASFYKHKADGHFEKAFGLFEHFVGNGKGAFGGGKRSGTDAYTVLTYVHHMLVTRYGPSGGCRRFLETVWGKPELREIPFVSRTRQLLCSRLNWSGLYGEELRWREAPGYQSLDDQILYARCLLRLGDKRWKFEADEAGRVIREKVLFDPLGNRTVESLVELNMPDAAARASLKPTIGSTKLSGEWFTFSSCFVLFDQRQNAQLHKEMASLFGGSIKRHENAYYSSGYKSRVEDLLPLFLFNAQKAGETAEADRLIREWYSKPTGLQVPSMLAIARKCKTFDRPLAEHLTNTCVKKLDYMDRLRYLPDVMETLSDLGYAEKALQLCASGEEERPADGRVQNVELSLARVRASLELKKLELAEEVLEALEQDESSFTPAQSIQFWILKSNFFKRCGLQKEAAEVLRAQLKYVCDSGNVSVGKKIEFLEALAEVCHAVKDSQTERSARAAAEKIMPARCRDAFNRWQLLAPAYLLQPDDGIGSR